MKHLFQLIFIAVLSCFSANVTAISLAEYLTNRDANTPRFTSMRLHLNGVADGLGWANTMIERKGQRKLFCQPPRLALNAENVLRLLDDYIKRHISLPPQLEVEIALAYALIDAFPCEP